MNDAIKVKHKQPALILRASCRKIKEKNQTPLRAVAMQWEPWRRPNEDLSEIFYDLLLPSE